VAFNNNSNLPTIQRVKYEDYKGAPEWFAQFLTALNLFFTAIYNIVNKGVTYANLAVIQPFTFSFTPGTTTNFKFISPVVGVPSNVVIGNVYIGNDLTAHPAVVTQVYWHYSQGFIFVDSIIGLTNGLQYTVAVLVS
jgi:hypothetical protein